MARPRGGSRASLDLVHHVGEHHPPRAHPARRRHDPRPSGDRAARTLGRVKGAYLRRRLRSGGARQARVVTTPSEYTRGLLIDRLDLDEAKCDRRAPHRSFRSERRRDAGGPTPAAPRGRSSSIPPSPTPTRTTVMLLRGVRRGREIPPRSSLVLTGARGRGEDAVVAEMGRLGLQDRVRRLGRILATDLERCSERAVALTFPSRHEGYGLPRRRGDGARVSGHRVGRHSAP